MKARGYKDPVLVGDGYRGLKPAANPQTRLLVFPGLSVGADPEVAGVGGEFEGRGRR